MHKNGKLLMVAFLAFLVATGFRFLETSGKANAETREFSTIDNRYTYLCGPNGEEYGMLDKAGRFMVPLPGLGSHTFKINTSSDSAQFYFNQGLNLFYSFHITESKASFLEARRHDSTCAMIFWGMAMAAGPTINSPGYDYTSVEIINGLKKGVKLAKDSLEKQLIDAQLSRYTYSSNASRSDMAKVYSKKMLLLTETHPKNTELKVLYADALMMEQPRDWYEVNKTEKAGTSTIIRLLETILQKDSLHPAALHYYIHMVEPSTTPERALDAANKLLPLLPSVAHMVHMPSHIYVRTGHYQKGINANIDAIKGYELHKSLIGKDGSRTLYLYHNADMQGTNALMMGNEQLAREAFMQNINQYSSRDSSILGNSSFGHYLQFLLM